MRFLNALRYRLLCAALACIPASLQAASAPATHALLITNDYAGSHAALNGINFDRQHALAMAQQLGVEEAKVRPVHNADLTTMRRALSELLARVSKGDAVFIYYSGHGSQSAKHQPRKGENKCQEVLVSNDLQSYPDHEFEDFLQRLSTRAAQVLVMNDSCFSGGSATKPLAAQSAAQAKTIQLKDGSANDGSYTCKKAINQGWRAAFLNLQEKLARHTPLPAPARVQARQQEFRPRLIYLAASSDNELSYLTPQGSRATLAWAHCLKQNPAQTGKQLLRCAQARLNGLNGDGPEASPAGEQQTLNIVGDGDIPLRPSALHPD